MRLRLIRTATPGQLTRIRKAPHCFRDLTVATWCEMQARLLGLLLRSSQPRNDDTDSAGAAGVYAVLEWTARSGATRPEQGTGFRVTAGPGSSGKDATQSSRSERKSCAEQSARIGSTGVGWDAAS